MVHQVRCDLGHAAGTAGQANASALAAEGDQLVVPAVAAAQPQEAVGQDAAFELGVELVPHKLRQVGASSTPRPSSPTPTPAPGPSCPESSRMSSTPSSSSASSDFTDRRSKPANPDPQSALDLGASAVCLAISARGSCQRTPATHSAWHRHRRHRQPSCRVLRGRNACRAETPPRSCSGSSRRAAGLR